MQKHLPNLITVFNLLAGCLSVTFLISGEIVLASWMIGLAAIFDFLDGMLARLLNVSSELGKVLDSLADAVSFGVAPGLIIFRLIELSGEMAFPLAYISLLIPALSAVRLARFAVDERQGHHFIGVPTPLNGLMLASFPLILMQYQDHPAVAGTFSNTWFLSGVAIISSLMLVAPIRIMALKFKSLSLRDNLVKYLMVLISVMMLIFFGYLAFPLIYMLYIVFSFFGK